MLILNYFHFNEEISSHSLETMFQVIVIAERISETTYLQLLDFQNNFAIFIYLHNCLNEIKFYVPMNMLNAKIIKPVSEQHPLVHQQVQLQDTLD